MVASCRQISRPYESSLVFSANGMGASRRSVAGWHRQHHKLDVAHCSCTLQLDTFAPVCSYQTLRMILAVSAQKDLLLRQLDVQTASLNGELEEVYVHPQPWGRPPGGGQQTVVVAAVGTCTVWAETGLTRLEHTPGGRA
jgi:hypothetical protein